MEDFIDLTMFANDKYKLLKFLYNNQIQVKEDKYIALSQQEIADMLHMAKLKTNAIMQELKKLDIISTYKNTRGKYIITEKGNKIINLIEKKY